MVDVAGGEVNNFGGRGSEDRRPHKSCFARLWKTPTRYEASYFSLLIEYGFPSSATAAQVLISTTTCSRTDARKKHLARPEFGSCLKRRLMPSFAATELLLHRDGGQLASNAEVAADVEE
jgi:hypothetical protein